MAKKITFKVIPGEALDTNTGEVVKTYKDEKTGETLDLPAFKYRTQFLAMVHQAQNGQGMDYDKLVEAMDLLDKLRSYKDGDEVILEDSEWRLLNTRLAEAKFNFASRLVIEMIKHVKDAPLVKRLEEVKEDRPAPDYVEPVRIPAVEA